MDWGGRTAGRRAREVRLKFFVRSGPHSWQGSERCHETSSCDKCHTFPQVSGVNFPPALPTRMSILPQESSYTQKITRCCTGT